MQTQSGLTALTFRPNDLTTTAKRKGLLPVSPATLWRMVKDGKFPKPTPFGASNFWPRGTVEKWMIETLGIDLTGTVVNTAAAGVARKERNPIENRRGRKPKAVSVEATTC